MISATHPRISILVATWNCAELLTGLLASLTEQSWTDWELLLLDNASSDGTAELVADHCQSYPSHRVHWSSCPDQGIYDAWNRGLSQARGDYICCVGADDRFTEPGSLGAIAALTVSQSDLITARNAYYSRDGRFLRHWGWSWTWRRMRQSMVIAHPGMLVKRSLFERFGGFDASFCICGDYEWFLRLPPELRTVHSSDSILQVVQAGVSHRRIRQVYAETFRAQCRHLGWTVSAVCWAINWLQFGRRRLLGLA